MGVVYQATDTMLDKVVALKALSERVSDQAALRFQAEAKAAGKLNHPNIVKILDFGISDEGEPYKSINELAEALNNLPEVETESAIAESNNPLAGNRINQVAITIAIATVSITLVGGFYAYSANQQPVADQTTTTEQKNDDPSGIGIMASMMEEATQQHNIDVPENTFEPKNEYEVRIKNVTPDILNLLPSRYPKLNCLELQAGREFDGRNLKALTALPELRYLKLIELPLKDSAIGELALLKQLDRLKFDLIVSLDGSGLNVLSQMKLREISYSYGMLNKLIVANISKTKAKVLSFKGSTGATAANLAPLRKMSSLRILAIENMNLVDSTLTPLKGLRLNVFRIGGNSRLTTKCFEVIRTIKGVQEVGFNGCALIPMEDRVQLGKELKLVYNTTLEHLFTSEFDKQKRETLELNPYPGRSSF